MQMLKLPVSSPVLAKKYGLSANICSVQSGASHVCHSTVFLIEGSLEEGLKNALSCTYL
jgi:hypothetical protein